MSPSALSVPRHCRDCALVPRAGEAVRVGELVDGRYRVVRQIGSGAMGQVFEARDVHLKRRVALKLLLARVSQRANRFFEREGQALANVRHSGVPTVFAFGVHGETPFFTMELVDGETLADVIAAHSEHAALIPLHRALRIADRVASALGAAHAAGVLHRDVKPENVIIEAETGRPVLVDFGIAAWEGDAAEGTVGTPAFMAPEIWRREAPSAGSDIYALGCLTFELLTGESAFEDQQINELRLAHLGREPRPASSVRGQLAPFDGVLSRAMSKDLDVRFSTCAAFRAALIRAAEGDRPTLDSIPAVSDAVRVLVVDDDPVFARIAKRAAEVALESADVEIERAKDAAAGLAVAAAWMPQLLLLDYNMPQMNGAELLSRIRSMRGGEGVSVLVMSGEIGETQRWRFSSLGVRDFVEKPAQFEDLVRVIRAMGAARGWLPHDAATRETVEEEP